MNTLYDQGLYSNMQELSNCLYVDLDSESADKMLYKCSDAISKNINKSLEKKPTMEGFSTRILDGRVAMDGEKCCPDGTTDVNGSCVEVCNNCDYNDCSSGSSNIGTFYKPSQPLSGRTQHLTHRKLEHAHSIADDSQRGSQIRSQAYIGNKKETKNIGFDEGIFNYIVVDIPN